MEHIFFTPDPAELGPEVISWQATCKQCVELGRATPAKFERKRGSGTGSLSQHMRAAHAKLFAQFEAQQAAAGPPVRGAKRVFAEPSLAAAASDAKRAKADPTQSKLAFEPSKPLTATHAMIKLFAHKHIPHSIADSSEFKDFVAAVRKHPLELLPKAKVYQKRRNEASDAMRQLVLARLKTRSLQSPAAVAVDGWTNVRSAKVTNVMVICHGVAYFWDSFENNTEAKNDAQWMADKLLPILQTLLDGGVRIGAFAADNEAAMKSLHRDHIAPTYPFIFRIPCAAHTIQLVVRDVLKAERWQAVQEAVTTLLKNFRTHRDLRTELNGHQTDTKYCLVKPNDTRWNSFFMACERLFLLRAPISFMGSHGSALARLHAAPPNLWTDLDALMKYLEPFKRATDVVQRDSSTLYDVFKQFHLLYEHVQHTEATVGRAAVKALKKRWKAHINVPASNACAILSLEHDLRALKFEQSVIDAAMQFVIDWGSSYLLQYGESDLEPIDLQGVLELQWGDFMGRQNAYSDLDECCQRGKSAAALKKTRWTASNYWGRRTEELARVAKALLAMPATEAAVERSFSIQGAIHSKTRNRLKAATVKAEVMLAFNEAPMNTDTTLLPPAPNVQPLDPLLPDPDAQVELTDSDDDSEEDSAESSESEESQQDDDDAMDVDEAARPAAAAARPAVLSRAERLKLRHPSMNDEPQSFATVDEMIQWAAQTSTEKQWPAREVESLVDKYSRLVKGHHPALQTLMTLFHTAAANLNLDG